MSANASDPRRRSRPLAAAQTPAILTHIVSAIPLPCVLVGDGLLADRERWRRILSVTAGKVGKRSKLALGAHVRQSFDMTEFGERPCANSGGRGHRPTGRFQATHRDRAIAKGQIMGSAERQTPSG